MISKAERVLGDIGEEGLEVTESHNSPILLGDREHRPL